jgi:hypothetical protein
MKSFVKFGLGTGLLVGVWNLSCFTVVSWINKIFAFGIPAARIRAYSGLFGLIILILGIYFGMKEVKRKEGQITYGKAIKTGISISLITAIIVAFFGFLYCTVINPGYADYMVKESEKALIAAKKSSEEIKQQLMKVRSFYSTSSQVLQALTVQLVVGIISSLILGLFVRTKK